MKPETLQLAAKLSEKIGHVLIATADRNGAPHLSAAGQIEVTGGSFVTSQAWHCPGTVSNLSQNRRCTLTIWDHRSEIGYQLHGSVDEITQSAVLDGYQPEKEESVHIPQVQWRLLIHVDSITEFRSTPHTDTEL